MKHNKIEPTGELGSFEMDQLGMLLFLIEFHDYLKEKTPAYQIECNKSFLFILKHKQKIHNIFERYANDSWPMNFERGESQLEKKMFDTMQLKINPFHSNVMTAKIEMIIGNSYYRARLNTEIFMKKYALNKKDLTQYDEYRPNKPHISTGFDFDIEIKNYNNYESQIKEAVVQHFNKFHNIMKELIRFTIIQ
jgi:hypothetical protein